MANGFIGVNFEDRDVTVGELREFLNRIRELPDDTSLGYTFDVDGELSGIQAFI